MEIIVQETDYFDRLPDGIIVDIFNKLLDAKSLTRCLIICKRFSSLVPQINNVFLSIIPVPRPRPEPTSKRSYWRIIFSKFKYFRRFIAPKPALNNKGSTISYPSLNKFRDIKFMNVQFPYEGGGGGDDCLIKWKAEFGKELRSCVILGATSFHERKENSINLVEEEQFLTDDQLKLRIVWTISCLVASSGRHHFLKQMVSDHPNLESVVVSDCENQGKLCMDKEQLLEMRKSMDVVHSLERSVVPDLSIKMLYSPVLELPASGYTMRGATLVFIRAVDDGGVVMKKESDGGDLLGGWFDGDGKDKAFGEAVREIMKMKTSYVMTINSF